jgi:hypothetical protein
MPGSGTSRAQPPPLHHLPQTRVVTPTASAVKFARARPSNWTQIHDVLSASGKPGVATGWGTPQQQPAGPIGENQGCWGILKPLIWTRCWV